MDTTQLERKILAIIFIMMRTADEHGDRVVADTFREFMYQVNTTTGEINYQDCCTKAMVSSGVLK